MRGRSWGEWWNAYWFPPGSLLHLAICRIVAVGTQLLLFFPDLDEHRNLVARNSEFIEPQLIVRAVMAVFPRESIFNPDTITLLYWATAAAGFLALIGLFTRTSLFLFALGTWFFVAHLFSYGDRHHTEALLCLFLMLLPLAPAGARLSVDAWLARRRRGAAEEAPPETSDLAIWPLKVAHVLFAITYFSAGISKMIYSGPRWLNGYTLQAHTFGDAVERGHPFGVWLAQQHTVAVALSVYTIVFEIGFIASLFLPRFAPLFILVALSFQIGLFVTAGYDFFQAMVLLTLLLFFLRPEWWQWLVARSREGGARAGAVSP